MMAKTSLQRGFRFRPTDVELIWYLRKRIMGKPFVFTCIAEVYLYNFAPWELPEKSQLHSNDREWYFFCPQYKKYSHGPRVNRVTSNGYWKSTAQDKTISHNNSIIGKRKTLVFYDGKAPNGSRTDWVMHEFRLEDAAFVAAGYLQDTHVVCKIFEKSGRGPKNGEQYGAPFNEEDYEDDDTSAEISLPLPPQPLHDQATSSFHATQQPLPSAEVAPNFDGISLEDLEVLPSSSPLTGNASAEMHESSIVDKNVYEAPSMDQEEIFRELENLCCMSGSFSDPEHPLLENSGDDFLRELLDMFND